MADSPQSQASTLAARTIDVNTPHIARVYDYWLGGKDNFAVDRKLGDLSIQAFPGIVRSVHTNRAFLARAVRYFAGELGIRQFLDIGTGIPTSNNTHQVAQDVDPECRIVYVDNDPMVLSHAQALLKSRPGGVCAYVDADMNDAAAVLKAATQTLDFGEPVAVMMISVLHFAVDPYALVRELLRPCVAGSGFAISHPASDLYADEMQEMIRRLNATLPSKTTLRSRDEVTALFDGFTLEPPGVVPALEWRPEAATDFDVPCGVWAGLAVKRLRLSRCGSYRRGSLGATSRQPCPPRGLTAPTIPAGSAR